MMRTRPDPRRRGRGAAIVVGALLALTAGQLGAGAVPVPVDRGIDRACDERAQGADRFADVAPGATHAGAINCLAAYWIVQGRFVDGANVYEPGAEVTRQQVASFVANALDQIPDRRYVLPDVGDEPRFEDAATISSAHERNVNRLHEAGVLSGYTDGTFRPGVAINRAQMATIIAGAIEDVIDDELPRTPVFDDVSGTHQAGIEKLTAIGVVQGRSANTYDPASSTTRAQMATFIARSLDYLVAAGQLIPRSFAPAGDGARVGLTDVTTGVQNGADRVTFTLDAGEGVAGWDVRYVEEAVAQGSGMSVDIEGDAIIEITLTGMALPPELDEDLWDEGEIFVDGDGIVEIIDLSVFEGQQQIFVGTTGLNDFSVDRLDDPQRIYLDVGHGS
jgi:hypothetical protein